MKKIMWVIAGLLLCLVIIFGSLFLAGKADWLVYVFYHPDKIDNPEAIAVSYAELEDFILSYSTADYPEDWGCGEYALAFHDAAEAEGIKTAIVLVRIGAGDYHAFNAFLLTSSDIVYADATVGWDIGKVGLVEEADGVLISRVEEDGRVKTQRLGYEKDFLFFW